MIRTLLMIAVAGFLVSAVTLSVAVAITGPEAIVRGAWSWGPEGWGWRHHHREASESRDDGPQTSRDIAWPGGERLVVSVPAAVEYTQSEGPAKLTVSGPSGAVADVRVEDGQIRYDDDSDHDDQKLRIVISAPSVTDFTLEGDETLSLVGYKQERLAVSVSGHADIKATGETRDAQIRISGSGRADLAGLKIRSARIGISGSGQASLAPTDAADIDITGSGEVTLLTNPPQLHTSITGSGQIHRPGA
jgi:hypothetical protein